MSFTHSSDEGIQDPGSCKESSKSEDLSEGNPIILPPEESEVQCWDNQQDVD
jgi:hypothetical protein